MEIRETRSPVNGAPMLVWRCCEQHDWIVPTTMAQISADHVIMSRIVESARPVPTATHPAGKGRTAGPQTPATVHMVHTEGGGELTVFEDGNVARDYAAACPGAWVTDEPVMSGADAAGLVALARGLPRG